MKKKSIFKSIIKYVTLTLLGIIILFNAVSFAVSRISDRPGRFFGRFMSVETGSMEPDICEGDLIYVLKVPSASLSPGDAVTVILDGKNVTHRLERVSDDGIVTKGLSNENEDSPVSLGDYLGKVMFVIPGGTVVYETLTSPAVCIAAAAAFILLLLTGPVAKMILKKEKRIKLGAVRITAAAAAVSLFLVPPSATLARYSGTLEGKKTIGSSEVNFTSNYLSESGNTYDIVGWNGSDYNTEIRIANYSNLLKYNSEGINLIFYLVVEKVLDDGEMTYTDDYTLTLTPETVEETVRSGGTSYNSPIGPLTGDGDFTETENEETGRTLTVQTGLYTLSGGIQAHALFMLTANAQTGGSVNLTDGQKIKYRISAYCVTPGGYRQSLYAEYTMTATTAVDFIEKKVFAHEQGTQLVKLTLKSATIMGITQRRVVVEWDPDVMFLNEYEMNTMSMLSNEEMTLDADAGNLEFYMKASASTSLEFYKRSSQLGVPLSYSYEVKTDDDGHEYEYFRIMVIPSA